MDYKSVKKYEEKRVSILWVDIVTHSGWYGKTFIDTTTCGCESVGFVSLIKRHKYLGDYLTLSSTKSEDEYNQHITIPIACIRRINLI
jgi:hypothetical protein